MAHRSGHAWISMLALGALLSGSTARADVAPSPRRPIWNEQPPPMPEPPPEKELVWAVGIIVVGLGAVALSARSRRLRNRRATRISEAT